MPTQLRFLGTVKNENNNGNQIKIRNGGSLVVPREKHRGDSSGDSVTGQNT